MGAFQIVEGELAVIVENGVYRQVAIYTRDGALYAAAKGGFVRLNADGSTSHTSGRVKLDTLTWSESLGRDQLGRLVAPDRLPVGRAALPLAQQTQQRLLGLTEEK